MAANDDNYNNTNDSHHMRRDIRDAYNDAKGAKLLSTLALIGASIALAIALSALNKANDALSNANRSLNTSQQVQR